MTITDATHALALRARHGQKLRATPVSAHVSIRLTEAMARVETSWVEAVAVVQAVCAQLPPGHAVPALDAIVLSPDGSVQFPATSLATPPHAVDAAGRLLSSILKDGDCPMQVWDAIERARTAPTSFDSLAQFGASLTCVAQAQGRGELRQFVASARQAVSAVARVTRRQPWLPAYGATMSSSV